MVELFYSLSYIWIALALWTPVMVVVSPLLADGRLVEVEGVGASLRETCVGLVMAYGHVRKSLEISFLLPSYQMMSWI
jgi:hypothetical protein